MNVVAASGAECTNRRESFTAPVVAGMARGARTLIRPGSGLIRHALLRAIKATAEQVTNPAGR